MRKIFAVCMMLLLVGSIHPRTGITTLEYFMLNTVLLPESVEIHPDSTDVKKMMKRMRGPSELKEKYEAKELREDFLQFRGHIEEVHPYPYAFTSRESFDASFRARYKEIDGPMSLREFYCLLAPLKGMIGDGHAHLDYPEEYRRTVQNHKFPLILSFLQDGCFVRKDLHEEPSLPLFSEILSIDGIGIESIEETLRSEIGADGHNRFFKKSALENCFQYYYANHYGAPMEFRIEYRAPGSDDIWEVVIPAIPCAGINYSNRESRDLDVQVFPDRDTAVLTIDSFSYYGDRNKIFFDFVDDAFTRINEGGIGNVVLDLRGNGGGDPFCASYLWAYIENEPQPYFSKQYGKYAELAKPIKRAVFPFGGRLFILTDGSNFSTTGHFCVLVRYYGRAVFVGTETGSTYTCNAAVKVFTLKNTGIGLKLATGSYAAAVDGFPRDRGIIPDHIVEPTIEDLKNGRDPVMDYAFKFIENRN